jgi:gamma-glutamyltranspeptidase/glutathione hydrolase
MPSFQFPSRRSAVLARKGMVATSQPLAAMAGLRILMSGGNAADAAVAVAAMLNVVEPMSTGIGGDCFALIYEAGTGQVTALNGSGRAPAAFALAEAQRRGLESIPLTGGLPVTVPGAPSGWEALVNRFGTMPLADCLAPAIATAEGGFPVSERISAAWERMAEKVSADPEARRVYLPAPRPGDIHRQPDLARTFRTMAEGGAEAFYHGQLAKQIATCVQSNGGYLTTEDIATHTATWETPIRVNYRDVEILEHPPNCHVLIAPMRWGLADAARYVADPAVAEVPVAGLLSKGYAAWRRALIQLDSALEIVAPGHPEHRDTVYLTVVDGQGNAVSFINSLFNLFGSGLVVPGTGICLQNRGACFTLEPGHLNVLAGGKRPYHTIIPAMALQQGQLWLSFGVMGSYMQPQGHLQVLSNLVDYGMNPQTALDAPRFRVDQYGGIEVDIETGVPAKTRESLAAMGHDVRSVTTFTPDFGSGDIIARDPETGVLWGAADPRKDGCAVGY